MLFGHVNEKLTVEQVPEKINVLFSLLPAVTKHET